MRLLEWITEAYTRPLAELTAHDWQPVRDGRVLCPLRGEEVDETTCVSCPRYVRTHTFHGGDGLWVQSSIVCDATRVGSDTDGPGS
jgi:hypothetical protein